jgi:hypothetical protein
MLLLWIVNLVELGYHLFRVGDIAIKAAIPLFTGVARPAVITERRVCNVFDFSDVVSSDLGPDIELDAIASGQVNCAILSSVVQLGRKSSSPVPIRSCRQQSSLFRKRSRSRLADGFDFAHRCAPAPTWEATFLVE